MQILFGNRMNLNPLHTIKLGCLVVSYPSVSQPTTVAGLAAAASLVANSKVQGMSPTLVLGQYISDYSNTLHRIKVSFKKTPTEIPFLLKPLDKLL